MAETYKILGQVAPTVNVQEKVLYSSPAATQTLITNITVTNRSASNQTFDLNIYDTAKVDSDFNPVPNTQFFAADYFGTNAASSTNGITWTTRTMPAESQWELAYGNNTFVALEVVGNPYTSTDGITWTARSLSSQIYWRDLEYGNGIFVAVSGYNQTSARSTDGITWTTHGMPTSATYKELVYGSGIFFTTTYGTTAASSTDGITWTTRTLPANSTGGALVYGNGIFVSLGYGTTTAARSTDGITWTTSSMPYVPPEGESYQPPVSAGAFGNNTFVFVGNYNTTIAFTTTDGITWAVGTLPAVGNWRGITFGNNIFVATNSGLGFPSATTTAATSTNGITWTVRTMPYETEWKRIISASLENFPTSPAINNLYKSATILANQSEILEPGITLGSQDSIVVSGNTNLTYSAYGVELS